VELRERAQTTLTEKATRAERAVDNSGSPIPKLRKPQSLITCCPPLALAARKNLVDGMSVDPPRPPHLAPARKGERQSCPKVEADVKLSPLGPDPGRAWMLPCLT
jgi:hypothetical protein